MYKKKNNRMRQHKFAEPTQEERRPVTRRDDYRDEQPESQKLRDLWRRTNVYERVALVLAALGAIFITWLATRGVP